MYSIKIILNIYYYPNSILKYLIENNKNFYVPINGGSKLFNYDNWCKNNLLFDFQYKNNISKLNNKFNEMTSIYVAWKQYDEIINSKYIGFNHYRRFFDPKDFQDFKNYDIIIGNRIHFVCSLLKQYEMVHNNYDINVMIKLLQNNFNEKDIIQFLNSHELYAPCNMFIMKKELFFQYCEFIFKNLFELEKLIILDKNNMYQFRALAFLSERLTSFWMKQQLNKNLKIKEIPIVFFKDWK